MCGGESREEVVGQLASYKLLESQILANCSNRAADPAEDAGKTAVVGISILFLKR